MALPGRVRIVEVGARDGLQNEQPVSAQTRIRLIDRLAGAGLRVIEAGSFVSPRWVPQMADTAEVLAGIEHVPGVVYPVLTPNLRGLEAALEAGVEEVAIFGAASESFSRANINCSIAESLERFRPVAERALAEGVRVRAAVSCVVECPYEGPITPAAVARVSAALAEMGAYEIALGDTIGRGTPGSIAAMLEAVLAVLPADRLAAHFHATYGQALANLYVALEHGIATIDASVAGLGGCPFAPGASGNVATEDVVYMLDGLGIETGVDLEKLVDCAWFISEELGRAPVSSVARAIAAKKEREGAIRAQ